MRQPELAGQIERRLLVNYRVDPEAVSRVLPPPFRPQLVGDAAVAGICLIRLGEMRPRRFPRWTGLRSENAAHRFAVEWDGPDGPRSGVYIPRRDSDSWLNTAVGGRLFPGRHHRADFEVQESDDRVRVAFSARDGSAEVDVAVRITQQLGGSHLFADLAEASAFFEAGSVGYSATDRSDRFDGLGLVTQAWSVEATTVEHARSSFFGDRSTFPAGTTQLDCALLMRRVAVTWEPLDSLHSHAG